MLPDPLWRDWPVVRLLAEAAAQAGGEVRAVGGAVRDALLGQPGADVDFATNLEPKALMAALGADHVRVIPTGLQHGTVTAVAAGQAVEVTTLRKDVATDGRHATVAFTNDWQADAARRDLTINALYAGLDGRLYDYFDGLADLKAGRVRFVGDPLIRLTEDALRVLRFYRFSARFARGPLDDEARAACRARAQSMQGLARERIQAELLKLLAAHRAVDVVAAMLEDGVLAPVVPEATHLEALKHVATRDRWVGAPDALLRLVALCSDQEPGPAPEAAMTSLTQRLKMSRDQQKRAAAAVARPAPEPEPFALAQAFYWDGPDTCLDRMILSHAREEEVVQTAEIARDWQKPRLPLKGSDLIDAGLVEPGPQVSTLYQALERNWVGSGFQLNKSELLAQAPNLIDDLA